MTDHENFDQVPYDEAETALQVAGIVDILNQDRTNRGRSRILDVGCGHGRIAAPLLDAIGADRIELLGVDIDSGVGESFRSATHGNADFAIGDLLEGTSLPGGPFDLILVLGNLFMTIREPSHLRDSYASIARRLSPGGRLVIDDFAEGGWAEIAAGRWADGVDETGQVQMIWIPGDPEFVVRMGSEVDPGSTRPEPGERILRLWSRRELDDAAGQAGMTAGTHRSENLLSVHGRGIS